MKVISDSHPVFSGKSFVGEFDNPIMFSLNVSNNSEEAFPTPKDKKESNSESRHAKTTSKPALTAEAKAEKRKASDEKYKPKKQLDQILQAMERGINKFQEKKVRAWSGTTLPGNESAVAAYNAFRNVREGLDREDDSFDKYHSKCAEIIEDLANTGDYSHATDLFLKLQTANPFESTSKSRGKKEIVTQTPSTNRNKRVASDLKSIIDISDECEEDEIVTPTQAKKPKLASKVKDEKKKRLFKRLNTIVNRFEEDMKDLIAEAME